jgi:hypothetical protein
MCSLPVPLSALQYGRSAPPGITSSREFSFQEPSRTSCAMIGFICATTGFQNWHYIASYQKMQLRT